MYEPVPQGLQNNSDVGDEDDSESELMLSSNLEGNISNLINKSPARNNGHPSDSHHSNFEPIGEQQHAPAPPIDFSTLSLGRKIAFSFSVINCVAFAIIFLWVLPCDYETCKAPSSDSKDLEWQIILSREVVQLMDVAPATAKFQEVLVVSSSELGSSSNCSKNSTSINLSAFRTGDGRVLWSKNTTEDIQYLNCSVIDVNSDGANDCLLNTEGRGLSVLDSSTGRVLWELHRPTEDRFAHQVPVIKLVDLNSVLDMNNDTVPDLMAIVIMDEPSQSHLIAISGRNGELLWQRPLNISCQTVAYVVVHPSCFISTGDEASGQQRNPSNPLPKLRGISKGLPTPLDAPSSTSSSPIRHVTHQDFVVTATVNCTDAYTLLKKTRLL